MFARSFLIFVINSQGSFLVFALLRYFLIKDDFVESVNFKVKVRCRIPESSDLPAQGGQDSEIPRSLL